LFNSGQQVNQYITNCILNASLANLMAIEDNKNKSEQSTMCVEEKKIYDIKFVERQR